MGNTEEKKNRTPREWIIYFLGAAMAIFDIFTLIFHSIPAQYFRSAYMFFTLVLIYLLYPAAGKGKGKMERIGISNLILLVLSIATTVYAFFHLEAVELAAGLRMTAMDQLCAVFCVICVLEACRRTTGAALPLIAVFFIIYAKVGQYIPGILGHKGYSTKRLLTILYSYGGIYGTALNTVATYVTMFMIFAAFLERTGAGDAFLELSMSLVGHRRGGPAKVAVVASALFGAISGSAVANVAATGSFTIPLMKRTGYDSQFAAGVVSVSSTGGQIMPPVMAAGAFLMADYLGVPYTTIAKAAVLPALIYFTICWISVDREAARLHLKSMDKEELKPLGEVLKKDWLMLLPVVVLIVLLVVFKKSSIRCAFYSMVVAVLICLFKKEGRMKPLEIIDVLSNAAKSIVSVGSACACAGIIVGCIGLTGLGMKISTLIISLSGGRIFLALVLAMLTAILFGMGLPTTVSYILCVSVLVPPLVEMGVLPISAHLFIFYFACMSGITPPVALAAYTGAGIAGSKPIPTAFTATKLACVAYFLPYMFVYNTAFLMEGSLPEILVAVAVGLLTCYALSSCLQGYCFGTLNLPVRIAFAVVAALLIIPVQVLDYIGIALFAALTAILYLKYRGDAKPGTSEPA